jgi:hypothetical protein
MSEPNGATKMAAIVEAAAAGLEAAERRTTADGLEWSIGGVTFAAVASDVAEFRLARPVVEAALRTPGTGRSGRGSEWVAFRPAELDQHAIDRAIAWLQSAWRRADGEG